MDTVLIVCGAGASSTFLALRMRRLARASDLDLVVEAGAESDLDDRLAEASIVLVGPHLADRFDDLNRRAVNAGVRAALLPDTVFGAEGDEQLAGILTELRSRQSRSKEIEHG